MVQIVASLVYMHTVCEMLPPKLICCSAIVYIQSRYREMGRKAYRSMRVASFREQTIPGTAVIAQDATDGIVDQVHSLVRMYADL